MKKLLLALIGACALTGGEAWAAVREPSLSLQLATGIGRAFDTGQAREIGLEVDLPVGRLGVYPMMGLVMSEDGSSHYYLCMARDLNLGSRFALTGATGVAIYRSGDEGLDLGGEALFRSGLELSVQINERLELGRRSIICPMAACAARTPAPSRSPWAYGSALSAVRTCRASRSSGSARLRPPS